MIGARGSAMRCRKASNTMPLRTMRTLGTASLARKVHIGDRHLEGTLSVLGAAYGLVIFAHGSGSSRMSPRNTRVAHALNARGLATLLFDLLTEDEAADRANVFDIRRSCGRSGAMGARDEGCGSPPYRPVWREYWGRGRAGRRRPTSIRGRRDRLARRPAGFGR
jgi:hypothetical protein